LAKPDDATIEIWSDASIIGGAALCSDGSWFQQKWKKIFSRTSLEKIGCEIISFLELISVGVLLEYKIPQWKNKVVTLFCDNKTVVKEINKKYSKSLFPPVGRLASHLALLCNRYHVCLFAVSVCW
jgi:hypothetical protein